MRAAVLTVSDGVAAGEREDGSGDVLAELLAGDGYEVERRIVPDDREAIADAIVELAESTLAVPPGWHCATAADGTLVMERRG